MPHRVTVHQNQNGEWYLRIVLDATDGVRTIETEPLRGQNRKEMENDAKLKYFTVLREEGRKIQAAKAFQNGEDITNIVDPPFWREGM